jgi:hypothetical protein
VDWFEDGEGGDVFVEGDKEMERDLLGLNDFLRSSILSSWILARAVA